MKEFWRIVNLIFSWIIGIIGILLGLYAFFDSHSWIQMVVSGMFILICLYIIPLIKNWIPFQLNTKYITMLFVVSFIAMVITSSMDFSNKSEDSDIDLDDRYYVTANKLNVRKNAGRNYDILYKLSKGDKVIVVSDTIGWSKIKTSHGLGFVYGEYLSSNKPEDTEAPVWVSLLVVSVIIIYVFVFKGSGSLPKTTPKPIKKTTPDTKTKMNEEKQKYFCKYCGKEAESSNALLSGSCPKHPNGKMKGRHVLYEGGVKKEYVCIYCGKKSPKISMLVSGHCAKHPNGIMEGHCIPSI